MEMTEVCLTVCFPVHDRRNEVQSEAPLLGVIGHPLRPSSNGWGIGASAITKAKVIQENALQKYNHCQHIYISYIIYISSLFLYTSTCPTLILTDSSCFLSSLGARERAELVNLHLPPLVEYRFSRV